MAANDGTRAAKARSQGFKIAGFTMGDDFDPEGSDLDFLVNFSLCLPVRTPKLTLNCGAIGKVFWGARWI
jgi:hypothetical protein